MQDVTIHGMSANGEGVGRLADGRVVFVDATLPGDVARVTLTETRRRVQYARLDGIRTASPGRCVSRCDVPGCGGCPWRMASLELQSRIKHQSIVETLRRLGGIDVASMLGPIPSFEDGWFVRHRARLHASYMEATDTQAAGWRLGYMKRRSRQLAPLSACPIIWPELERLALALAQGVALLPKEAGLKEVDLAYSRRDVRGGVRVLASGPLQLFRDSLAWLAGSDVLGVEVVAGDGTLRHGNLELRYDHAHADAYDLRFEAGLFTQAVPKGNDLVVAAVLAHAAAHTQPRLLELHAGIGNFSVPLSRAGAQVVAYELSRRAAILCERNARSAGTALQVMARPDLQALPTLKDFDSVLLDPPRAGARAVAEAVAHCPSVKQVMYVSCDVGSLARDLKLMRQGGLQLTHIEAFDLFPQTPHVETFCVLRR